MGTPLYMSPEQHEGRPTDARSDQFSFCVALYTALYGSRPFAGDTLPDLAANVRADHVEAPPIGSSVPPWLRAALRREIQAAAAIRDADAEASAWAELIRVAGAEQLRFDEALALRPAAEAAMARAGSSAGAQAMVLAQIGRVLTARGDTREGMELMRQAAERARSTDAVLAARLDAQLAEELVFANQLDEADRRAASAHEVLGRELGPGHPLVAMTLSFRAMIDQEAGRHELAVTRMTKRSPRSMPHTAPITSMSPSCAAISPTRCWRPANPSARSSSAEAHSRLMARWCPSPASRSRTPA